MKTKNKIYSLVAVLILLLSSCSSDSSTTPCVQVVCLNEGVSNSDCGCDCKEGYSGENCSVRVAPKKVIITKVVVKSFDNLNPNGIPHDIGGLPDIYIKISRGSQLLLDYPSFYSNVTNENNQRYDFPITPNLEITNISTQHTISLWDYDLGDIPSSADDFMGEAKFFPYNGNEFPNFITIFDPITATSFEVYFRYEW